VRLYRGGQEQELPVVVGRYTDPDDDKPAETKPTPAR
jgi:hypothetical protein